MRGRSRAQVTVCGDIRVAVRALGANVTWSPENLSDLPAARAIDQNVDAAAVPAQAGRGLEDEVADAVAIEVGCDSFDRIAVVVFEVVCDPTTNVGRHVDR